VTLKNGKVYTVACRAELEGFEKHMPMFQMIFAGFLLTQ
jgi:hypothetical protein